MGSGLHRVRYKGGLLYLGGRHRESQRRPLNWILKSTKWFIRKIREERIFQDLIPPTTTSIKSAS